MRDTAEIFVERKQESSNLKGLLDQFSNLKNPIKIPPLCNYAGEAAEIFVERRYRTSHHTFPQRSVAFLMLGTPLTHEGRQGEDPAVAPRRYRWTVVRLPADCPAFRSRF